jgi:hypothetical protein
MTALPRYPIYIPSKGRYEKCLTAQCFDKDGVPFCLVVEPQERDEYVRRFGEARVLTLPFSNLGLGSIPARNWIKDHATAAGAERHWQFDDNISGVWRWWRGRRLYCRAGVALAACEDFVDRYENIAVAGLNYVMFGVGSTKPFVANVHVYSATLVLNSIPHRWRGRYNEDTDLCLQVLADGWCTVLFNAFLVQKIGTMTMKGGNSDQLYQGDGRLKMARALERQWPGVVETKRRFKRPQHVIKDSWRRFDTPLKLKPGIILPTEPNEYGMKLRQVKPTVKSADLRALLAEQGTV